MEGSRYPTNDEQTNWAALVFSGVAHLFFLGVLFLGIQWKRQVSDVVSVELWRPGAPVVGGQERAEGASMSAAPLPEPAPMPERPAIKPEIAVKNAKVKEKKDEKRAETKPDKPQRLDFSRALNRELRDQQRAAMERELRESIDSALSSSGRGGSGSANVGADRTEYDRKIKGKIRGNMILPAGIPGNPTVSFRIVQLPTGEIMAVTLLTSSGYPPLDAAVERAIFKSSPLPKPDNPALFDRDLVIHYRQFD